VGSKVRKVLPRPSSNCGKLRRTKGTIGCANFFPLPRTSPRARLAMEQPPVAGSYSRMESFMATEPKRPEPDIPPQKPDVQPEPRPEEIPPDIDVPEKEAPLKML
jgi:hypothetical protein